MKLSQYKIVIAALLGLVTSQDIKQVTLVRPETSSDYYRRGYKPEHSIDKNPQSSSHTMDGIDQWWKADFESATEVHKVRIQNRDWDENRLANSEVTIDGQVCGYLPEQTEPGMWYDIECWDPIFGKSVKIATTEFTYLHIAEVEVYGVFEQKEPSNFDKYISQQGKCRLERDINAKGEFFFLNKDNTWVKDYIYNPVEDAEVCARSCDENRDRCKGFHLYSEGHEVPRGECVFQTEKIQGNGQAQSVCYISPYQDDSQDDAEGYQGRDYTQMQGKCRLEKDINAKGNYFFLHQDGTWTKDWPKNGVKNANVCKKSCDENADRCLGFHLYQVGYTGPEGECVFQTERVQGNGEAQSQCYILNDQATDSENQNSDSEDKKNTTRKCKKGYKNVDGVCEPRKPRKEDKIECPQGFKEVNGTCEPRKDAPRRDDEDDYWREGDQECKRWRGPDGKWEQECWKSDDYDGKDGNEIFSVDINYMDEEEASLWVGQSDQGGMQAELEVGNTVVTIEANEDDDVEVMVKTKSALYLTSSAAAILALSSLIV